LTYLRAIIYWIYPQQGAIDALKAKVKAQEALSQTLRASRQSEQNENEKFREALMLAQAELITERALSDKLRKELTAMETDSETLKTMCETCPHVVTYKDLHDELLMVHKIIMCPGEVNVEDYESAPYTPKAVAQYIVAMRRITRSERDDIRRLADIVLDRCADIKKLAE